MKPGVATPKPFAGVTLKIAGSDAAAIKAFGERARGWASRNGASVEVIVAESVADADIAIVSPAAVGILAEAGDALPVPAELKGLEHPGVRHRMLANSRDRLAGWAGEARAVPLAGEGFVLVIRTDRLMDAPLRAGYTQKFGRNLPLAPTTWEDLAEISEVCAELKLGALPARSDADAKSLHDYFRVAACYDRLALNENDISKKDAPANVTIPVLSFTCVADTGEPRLDAPGFAAALKWLARVQPGRVKGNDNAVSALASGQAAFAILSLAELARLPRDASGMVLASISVAPLPGSRTTHDFQGKLIDCSTGEGNYVPYLAGGWFGVVRKNCANPAAAFELLADLASPARSLELLSDPALGFGPFRLDHLEHAQVWQRYGFDAARQKKLAEALRRNAAITTVNPALCLRGPEAADLTTKLAQAISTGNAAALATAWPKSDAAARSLRRHAAGLP